MCSMDPDWECELMCVRGTHPPIPLPHTQNVLIGRSPATMIMDKKVSRHQVELRADCFTKKVKVKQVGSNPCAVGCQDLEKGKTATLKEGILLHVLTGKYPHKVRFYIPQEKYATKSDQASACSSADIIKPVDTSTPTISKKTYKQSTKKDPGVQKKFIDDFFGGSNKRKIEEENGSSSKKAKIELQEDEVSDDEEEEARVRQLQKQLEGMQQNFKKNEEASRMRTPAAGKEEKTGAVEAKRGSPASKAVWEEHGLLLMHTSQGVEARHKIAAFDIDSTIICTQSGKVFPTHPQDWKIMLSEIPKKLQQLFQDGYKIVFFTNQSGIKRGKVKVGDYKKKIEGVISKLGVPVQIFASTGPGPFRKPGLGMWNFLLDKANDGIQIDIKQSMYVGDAAGRPEKWAPGRKKDFSCSDRLFAHNAKLDFYTPEEYFLRHKKAPFKLPDFNPAALDPNAPLTSPPDAILKSASQEVIVMVGFPASGKSFFVKQHMSDYVIANRDTLKTWQKCVELTKRGLKDGKSVVVDNTNPDKESRKRYVDVAKAAGVICRCFHFATSFDHCRHNERFREMTDKSHQTINDMIMYSFRSKFQEPTLSEGFTEIIKINFIPKFPDEKLQNLYKNYLLEK